MEMRRRGRSPALQLPPLLSAIRATGSLARGLSPAPRPGDSHSAPEGSHPSPDGFLLHPAGSRHLPPGVRPVGGPAGAAAAGGFRTLDRGGAAVGARFRRVPARPPTTSRRAAGGFPPQKGPILAPLPFSIGYRAEIKLSSGAMPWARTTVWQRVGAHPKANAPACAGKSCIGDENAAEELF